MVPGFSPNQPGLGACSRAKLTSSLLQRTTWSVALQARDKSREGPAGPSFVGSAGSSAQGLLLVGDIGFERYHTPERFLLSPKSRVTACYSFQDLAPLANLLKQQEGQSPLEEEEKD